MFCSVLTFFLVLIFCVSSLAATNYDHRLALASYQGIVWVWKENCPELKTANHGSFYSGSQKDPEPNGIWDDGGHEWNCSHLAEEALSNHTPSFSALFEMNPDQKNVKEIDRWKSAGKHFIVRVFDDWKEGRALTPQGAIEEMTQKHTLPCKYATWSYLVLPDPHDGGSVHNYWENHLMLKLPCSYPFQDSNAMIDGRLAGKLSYHREECKFVNTKILNSAMIWCVYVRHEEALPTDDEEEQIEEPKKDIDPTIQHSIRNQKSSNKKAHVFFSLALVFFLSAAIFTIIRLKKSQ